MAYNEILTDKIRKALAGVTEFEEKTMFRGVTMMVNDKMCVTVGDEEIMFRIDPELHEQYVVRSGCRAMTMKGREYKGYIFVHENSVARKKDLDEWIALALDYNKTLVMKKKKSSTSKTKKTK